MEHKLEDTELEIIQLIDKLLDDAIDNPDQYTTYLSFLKVK